MLKESHKLLGEYLFSHCVNMPVKRYKKLFLWGCIEPDYNYLTYLKGSLKIQPFRGHHYPNGQSRILRLVRRLRRNCRRSALHFYRLGKLMHYLSDAFTHTHNPAFGGRVKGHHTYERNLHSHFQNRFSGAAALLKGKSGSAETVFLDAHRQYTRTAAGPCTDLDYILNVTGSVFRLLIPETITAAIRSRKLLLDGLYGVLRRKSRGSDEGVIPCSGRANA